MENIKLLLGDIELFKNSIQFLIHPIKSINEVDSRFLNFAAELLLVDVVFDSHMRNTKAQK